MLQDFHIVHRLKPATFLESEVPIWSTCLRSLAFTANASAAAADDEVYVNKAAYAFLLEVICGLKSPIVGETEVFGQFKQFSQEWLKSEPGRVTLVQKVLADAKAIRSAHLLDLGVQSYGSWIRHNLKTKRAHFLGAGQMVREIMPYLLKKGCEVKVHARDPHKTPELNAFALQDRKFDSGTLIVAAPLSAPEILQWLNGRQPTQLIDLRDNSSDDRLEIPGSRLHDIFSEIEKTKQRLLPRLEAAQEAIQECSRKAFALGIVRPQGWDDLCA